MAEALERFQKTQDHIITEYAEEVGHRGMDQAKQLTEKRKRAAGGDEAEAEERSHHALHHTHNTNFTPRSAHYKNA